MVSRNLDADRWPWKDTAKVAAEVRRLNEALGPTLVAALAGSREDMIAQRWTHFIGPRPTREELARIRRATKIWAALADLDGKEAARHWFISANHGLYGDTPVDAIREDRFRDVEAAARVAIDGSAP